MDRLKLKVFAFSWNVASVRFTHASNVQEEGNLATPTKGRGCKVSDDNERAEGSRVKASQRPSERKDDYLNSQDSPPKKPQADFIHPLLTKINNHDIIIIALQEDSIRDSPLLKDHDSIIPQKLSKEYTLLDLIELSGWGVTTYRALKNNWEYLPRGLRLAVFAKKEIASEFKTVSASYICPSIRDKITWGKGAVVVVLTLGETKLAIMNMHLPFTAKSLHSPETRKPAVEYQEYCMKTLIENVTKAYSPTDLIILGDLNFRVTMWDSSEDAQKVANTMNGGWFEDYLHFDELMKLEIYQRFTEGVNGNGPQFLPTCKLAKRRVTPVFKLGKNLQRYPSWCDRILATKGSMKFVDYSRFEFGNMNLSDHAGVIAELEFTLVSPKRA